MRALRVLNAGGPTFGGTHRRRADVSNSSRPATVPRRSAPAIGLLALLALSGAFIFPSAAHASSLTIGHFTATVSDVNEITFDWQVSGGATSNQVSIDDVGLEPQACPDRQPVGCSTSVRVARGGYFRYTLSVSDDLSQVATATTEVFVPPLTPPTTPSPRVNVDMLRRRPQTLSWSHGGPGFAKLILPRSLVPMAETYPATGAFSVTTTSLPIGGSTFHVLYCEQPDPNQTAFCSQATPVTFVVGPSRFSGPYRHFVPVHHSVRLSWSGSGNSWYLSSPTLGVAAWLRTSSFTVPAAQVSVGLHKVTVMSCWATTPRTKCDDNADIATTEIVAGGGPDVPTWTVKSWNTMFSATTYETWLRPATGSPLDVTFDSLGDIWQVGEFSTAIASVQNGELTDFDTPIDQTWDPGLGVFEPVTPYAFSGDGTDTATSMSELGERVIDTGSAIWYTQGGGFFYSGSFPNHSRLVRFDYADADDPTDPAEGLMCALEVPGNNNQVIGVAYDKGNNRVWFTESRPGRASALDWFVDDGSIPCDNDLDYSNQGAVDAVAAANQCATDTQTACLHEISLPPSAGAAGQITVDPWSGYVWFVDYTGHVLNRYPLGGGTVQSFPLPATMETPLLYGGFPWQIRADANAVYVNLYKDNQLLRFNKDMPATTCERLRAGENPCISELLLPMFGPDVRTHSIALAGGKLWFTIANESDGPDDPTGSTFGYINIASWARNRPTGVYFDNLARLGVPRPNDHHSFRGIDVTASGNIALADMGYDEIVALSPK